MLVGGNGAGKSTFYRLYLEPLGLPFINADNIARQLYPQASEAHSYEAARLAEQMRNEMLLSGASFCFETVYSHPAKIDFVARARTLGYEVIMVVVHLQTVALNRARVAERVAEGGHGVPDEKIQSRIPRTLRHIKDSIPLCNRVQVYDNSSADVPFQPVFSVREGLVVPQMRPLPDWAEALLPADDSKHLLRPA
jgi:predicted ABC-type ATPase